MTTYTNISARALLVGLSVSTWAARKYNKKVSKEVSESKQADAQAGRYNKHLLAGAASHERVLKAAQALRDLHYAETLPWADEGWRLLPTSNYMTYTEKMRKAFSAYDSAVSDFERDYPNLRAAAPAILGQLYDDKDFPALPELSKKFARTIDYKPVPERGDVRVDLPADQISAIEASIAAKVEEAAKAAMQDAWARLREAVARIAKAAATEGERKGIVRSTLIENVASVCDTLRRLNVADDEQLEALRVEVEREFATLSVDDLRDNDLARAEAKRKADAILARMGMFAPAVAA